MSDTIGTDYMNDTVFENNMDMNERLATTATTSYNQQYDNDPTLSSERRCWICFGEDDDTDGRWVKPCPCSLVAHEQCLLDWITENQKGRSPMKKVLCPQCARPYYLLERNSISLRCLEFLRKAAKSTAPYLMVLGLGCSVLVAASTYGAYTILTLFGVEEGERLLGPTSSWTWRMFLGLPSIPFALIASRSRLADGILPVAAIILLRSGAPSAVSWPPSPALIAGSLPWIRLMYFTLYSMLRNYLAYKLSILPSTAGHRRSRHTRLSFGLFQVAVIGESENQTNPSQNVRERSSTIPNGDNQDEDMLYGRTHRDLNVTVLGALLWPTISGFIGKLLNQSKSIRRYLPEAFHRNVLGGCLFVVAKDLATLLYRYERICQRRSRRVRSFDDPPSEMS
ncbi:hypothetical protein BCR42DRAFT_382145 [Absidia repens]|uniref:RING-CH-type domain-containing protein n=1 Tax=Absidia repens TaxID=90262 RepID=A0A1X2I479_9FUNG|nr:hypothetical protein BCR42DRAFT_382145 [Absidia repens]